MARTNSRTRRYFWRVRSQPGPGSRAWVWKARCGLWVSTHLLGQSFQVFFNIALFDVSFFVVVATTPLCLCGC